MGTIKRNVQSFKSDSSIKHGKRTPSSDFEKGAHTGSPNDVARRGPSKGKNRK